LFALQWWSPCSWPRPGHTEGEAQRRGAGAGLFGPRGM